ncbi:peptidase M16 inactive domain protein [Leptospira inadai serovar Lyme str. 10]|uniref:Peptidase M16 inactive domain protein n=2 Tax=Leptospira inadai serovar Lyme TaxID=293084 RepID=V6HEC4_9LEPT|nr:pitrilysin family protein [Leptospira inadai]EQA38711.1 peptidase M16 inactive domain protein [Leptospira inadai serovar Lyme str. 10]PNV72240.1 peptidase M16 [Leptospira inadai serovar Lyme]
MKFSRSAFFILLVLLLLPVGTNSAPGDFVKNVKIPPLEFHFPEIKEIQLNPNTRVLFLPNGEFPLRTLEISFYAGPSYYPQIKYELSEVLPEAWKKGGTQSHPGESFAEVWESYGSRLRVDSDLETVTLTFSWLTRYDKESRALISEFLNQPKFGQEAFEIAKLQLGEQIKRRNDNIAALAGRKALELAYKGKIRGTSVSQSRLDGLTEEAVSDYYKNVVLKSRKSVLVTGEWQDSEVPGFLAEVLPNSDEVAKKDPESLSQVELEKNLKSVGYKNLIVDKGNTQNVVLFLGVGPAHNHPDFYAIQLLNYIVGGGGFNSYFMSRIRSDKGLAYSSSSHPIFEKDHSLIFFMTQTKSQTTMEVYDLMGEILSDKTFSKITEEELKNAKEAILNKFIFLFTDSLEILRNEARFREHRMPKDYLRIYRDKIQAVSLEDLRKVGKAYFRRDGLTAIVSGPKTSIQQDLPSLKVIGPEDPVP